MGFGYLSAAIIALIVLLALKKYAQDRALWRRVKRNLPQAGAAGRFIVLSAGSRRLPAGTELRVPFEGTLGGSMSCDVCVPYKKVHMRSAFFWVEGEELHLVPLHKDGFLADETPIEPGDEAVMRDGAHHAAEAVARRTLAHRTVRAHLHNVALADHAANKRCAPLADALIRNAHTVPP